MTATARSSKRGKPPGDPTISSTSSCRRRRRSSWRAPTPGPRPRRQRGSPDQRPARSPGQRKCKGEHPDHLGRGQVDQYGALVTIPLVADRVHGACQTTSRSPTPSGRRARRSRSRTSRERSRQSDGDDRLPDPAGGLVLTSTGGRPPSHPGPEPNRRRRLRSHGVPRPVPRHARRGLLQRGLRSHPLLGPERDRRGPDGLYGSVWVNEQVAIVVGNLAILRSTDGGRRWTPIVVDGLGTTLWDVDRSPDTGTLVAVGVPGHRLPLRGRWQTWTSINPSTTRTLAAVTYAGGETWFAVGQDRIMISDNDGNRGRIPNDPGVTGKRVSVAFRDAQTGIVLDAGTSASGTGRTWRTTDGGQSWNNVFTATGVTDVTYAGDDTWFVSQRTPGGSTNVLRSRQNGAPGTWSVIGLRERPARARSSSPRQRLGTSSATRASSGPWTAGLVDARTGDRRRSLLRSVGVYDENRSLATGISVRSS